MQFEHELGVRSPPDHYFWAKVRLAVEEVLQIAEFVELIIEQHNTRPLPYSFLHVQDGFDATGRIREGVGELREIPSAAPALPTCLPVRDSCGEMIQSAKNARLRRWEPDEDKQLREMVEAGTSVTMIALRLTLCILVRT
jgi:hypothetical protein